MGETIDILLNARMQVSDVISGVGQIQKSLQGLTIPKGISDDLEKSFNKLTPLLKDYQKQLSKGFDTKKDLNNFNLLRGKIDEVFGEIKLKISEINGQDIRIKTDVSAITKMEKDLDEASAKMQQHMENIYKTSQGQTKNTVTENLKKLQDAIPSSFSALTKEAQKITTAFNGQNFASFNRQIDQMYNHISKLKDSSKIKLADSLGLKYVANDANSAEKALGKFFSQLQVNKTAASAIERIQQQIKELAPNIEQAKLDAITNGLKELDSAGVNIDNLSNSMHQIGEESERAASGVLAMKDQVAQLKTSTQYFFSLRNMINLLKRGIDDAIQSVKELDAAMTQTAVVTDFNVGDMWEKLPEYTANANALGATVKDMYEATTLYYQQGLDTEQSMSIAAETMKMARIGGLEAADATDKMTAALRGFNMELDEASAKRVNDVYSNLAAKTASDTEELGTAMQRTASIAASAGMSFEGTAAFLAQAIETTREPAENLGTAMKTIVARFTELKKNPLEITEVDGEEVDYNKVDTALKSIGVSLKDANGQFRELDQVFLDIAQRWDSLSQTQQRYVATTAAGSRQQSRFIAMMSNYERTVQLMDYANNSAGASNEQFGKTMESLEAKLNKLHNAWQQFTMGIANNSMIKGAVDGLTGILNVTNTLIDTLSGGIGPLKSLLSVLTAFTALKTGGRMINSLIGGLGGLVDPTSSIKEGLKGGFFGGRGQLQAERISNPIVKAIYSLIPHIDKAAQPERPYKFQEAGQYNHARSQLKSMMGGAVGQQYRIGNLQGIIESNQLNKEQQYDLLKASPGLKKNLLKSVSTLLQNTNISAELNKGLIQGLRNGNLTLEEVFDKAGLYTTYSDKLTKIGKEQGKDAAADFARSYGQNLFKQGQKLGLEGDALRNFINNSKIPTEQLESFLNTPRQLSGWEKMQNVVGQVGAGLMSAGSGLQMFGAQLSATNPALGQFVSGLGGVLTSVGSLATAIPALMNPLTLGLAAIGTAIYLDQRRIEKIKKTAQDVSDSFENTNKTTQDNIALLKGYRDELAALSSGVDINGNNVNLSDSQYSRYIEIADSIAEINPKIVRGYNAQGHAIIDNNNALAETLALQEQIQSKAIKDYVDSKSLQKILNARNVDKNYTAVTTTVVGEKAPKWQEDQGFGGTTRIKAAPMTTAVKNLVKEFDKQKGLDIDSILQGYNISLEQLQNGEEQAINTFVKNQDKIQTQVNSAIAFSGEEANKALVKSFSTLEEQTAAFDKSVAPVVQNLQTYVSNLPAFKNIGPEFQSALMSGLKDIAIQPDLDASEMQKQSRLLIQEFDNLTNEGSQYAKAMEEVESAQDKFAESLDASEYTKNTEHALITLNDLMAQYAGRTDAYSQAITEYLQNQYDKIKNFTEEGGASLTEAINGVTNTISAAEGAYSNFQESTKTDLSTGKDSMKSIFDEIVKETDGVALHMEAFGDGTMWKGARVLLGDDFVRKNAENVDVIKNEIRSLESELQNGEAGFAAFWENFQQVDDSLIEGFTWLEDGKYSLDRDINPDAYKQIAEQMHRSEEYVVAMLNAGRQFADIDFSKVNDVRKALSTDEAAIKSGNQIFVKSDYLDSALDEAQIYSEHERNLRKNQYAQGGIFEIKTPDIIKAADFTSMGIKDLGSLIKSFVDTGQYTQDEIAEYANALRNLGLDSFSDEDFASAYGNYINQLESPELKPIQSIESTVQEIAGLIKEKEIKEGNVSEADEQAQKDFHHSIFGEEGADTEAQYFRSGKNKYGNKATAADFQATLTDLDNAQKEAEHWAELYEQGAKKANGEEKKRLEAIAKGYRDDAEYLANTKEIGSNIWKQQYAKDKAESLYGKGAGVQGTDEYQKAYNDALVEAQQIVDGTYQGSLDGIQSSSSKGTQALAQYQIDQINQGFNNLLAGITSESINTTEAQTALNQLYQATLGDPATLTSGLMLQMQNLGIDVQKAIESGLVVDKEGVWQAAQTTGQQTAEAGVGGNAAGQQSVDTSKAEEVGQQKGKETVEAGVQGYVNGQNTTPVSSTSSTPLPQGVAKAEAKDSQIDVSKTTYEVDDSQLDNAQDKAEEVTNTLANGANFTIKVSGVTDLEKAATAAAQVTKNSGKKTVGVSTSFDNKEAADGVSSINSMQAKINVGATVDSAIAAARRAQRTIDAMKAKIDVSANFTGTWSKTVYVSKTGPGAKAYTGVNNKISYHHIPTAGSLASGTKKGRVGPRNQGGLTLTGELGYEVAWLPNENRSVILGANGPQMVNLPKDAIVYNHDQSKEIMKKRTGIAAGSMDGGNYKRKNVVDVSGGSVTSSNKKSSKSSKSAKKEKSKEKKKKETPKIVNFSIEETVRFNIDARLEKLGYEIDKRTKSIEKTLGRVGTTSKSIKGVVQDQLSALQQQKQANSELLASYQRQSNEIFNWQEQFSYQAYQKTTTGKGKKEKTTNELTTLTGVYNLRDFMMQQADGSYTINEGMIAAIGNMEIEKQVHDSVSNAVSSINNGMIKAKQAMDEVDEKIEDLQNKLYETFNRWKKSIDAIYLISQKLEIISKRRDIRESQYDVALLQLKTGFDEAGKSLNKMIEATNKSMNELTQSITGNYALITEKYKKYNEAIQLSNYNEYQDSTDAQDKYAAAKIALRLYQQSGGNMDKAISGIKQAIAAYNDEGYGIPTDEAVKEILDTIHERRTDLLDSINEVLSEISDAFEKFVEYQETVKSFEDELLDGLEKETEDQIDALSKLNDSLTKALKNLLDEVKRKLDERRRVEDNAKTELDITRKQQRLAALRANTSGGNQVEVAQLEKEIADSQQLYQRTLEDQLLDKLQQQADRAEQQRERQIQLLEILKDVESSTNKVEIEKWLNDPEKFKNEIYEAWKAANDYDEATTRGKELLDSQFKSDFAEVVVALGQLESLDDISNEIDTIIDVLLHSQTLDLSEDFMAAFLEDLSAVEKNLENAKRFKGLGFGANDLRNAGWDLNTLAQAGYGIGDLKEASFGAAQLKALKDENGNNRYSLANLASYYSAKDLKGANYSIGELKNYFSAKDLKNAGFNEYDFGSAQISYANAKSVFSRDALEKVAYYKTSVQNEKNAEQKARQDAYNSALANLHDIGEADKLIKIIQTGKALGKKPENIFTDMRKGGYHYKTSWLKTQFGVGKRLGDDSGLERYVYDLSERSGYSRDELRAFVRALINSPMAFATGGLANFTGPAWLDGTPSKPELVLNAQDTKNFIALKDVLSHAMGTTKNIDTSYGGDNIYEININVDKIEKDYDVDRVAERVKKMIVKDSSYRNVTQVRNFR